MARTPETRYAKGPGGDIAYQVVGDGPMDLVVVPGWFSHVDMMWADRGWTRFNEWQLFSPSGQQDDPVESLLAASREV